MTAIWPDPDLPPAPDHPLLQAIGAALAPLTPLLRSIGYDPAGPQPSVTVGFGGAYHLCGIRGLDADSLLLDLPIGEVPASVDALCTLLAANHGGAWLYRVDGPHPATPGYVTVVIEHLMPVTELRDLPGRLLSGWQEKLVRQGLLETLLGHGDAR